MLGQANQIYCKWIRILPSPDNPNEMYIVIMKDKPMSVETAKSFDERYKAKDVILTVTILIRKKHNHNEGK